MPADDTTSTDLVTTESSEAIQIRYVEKRVSGDQGAMFLAMPGAAVPRRGRNVMNIVYAAPGLTFLVARLATIGGPFTPGWKALAAASIVAEIGLLTFRRPVARVVERATVRWTVWAGRHPELTSIEGTIAAGDTLQSELSGRRAVLVRTRRKEPSNSLVSDGLRGVDFTIVADDARHYAVSPSPHLYFDEPPSEPNDGVGKTETLLCPGDRVHVWGTAVSEPSASGERPNPRSPPLRWAIVGSEGSPLVIRFARPPMVGRHARRAAKEQGLLPR